MIASLLAPVSLDSLSRADQAAFVAALGGIFEHSPWVAEAAWEARPFASVEALHGAMSRVVREAPAERRLALIRAHPELAGREAAAGTLTADSTNEQASAGLNACSPAEFARLRELNREYREKHGFPYVLAVRGRSRLEILRDLEERLGNGRDAEFDRALREIENIARLRLAALLAPD